MWHEGRFIRAVRVASDIELHVPMHDDCDGRLMPPYLRITYSDVRRTDESLQVISSCHQRSKQPQPSPYLPFNSFPREPSSLID